LGSRDTFCTHGDKTRNNVILCKTDIKRALTTNPLVVSIAEVIFLSFVTSGSMYTLTYTAISSTNLMAYGADDYNNDRNVDASGEQANPPVSSSSSSVLQTKYLGIYIDTNGVPYVNYNERGTKHNGIGVQRNPVTIIHTAMDYYNEGDTKFFINNANWLVDNAIPKNGFSTFEYTYDWPVYNLKQPWRSAMANGEALVPLVKAHAMTGNITYLDTAKELLNSFFVEVKDGGITYKDSENSWWYEEYVADNIDAEQSRVLNGMLFALIGVQEYYEYTNDIDAKLIFDRGIDSVKENLDKYDNGEGHSYYDIYHNPPDKYHLIHVDLLNRLYDITHEEIFREYSEKWNGFLRPT
jgi:heparosan-N-sulfate-glucuronate 5-epimerase